MTEIKNKNEKLPVDNHVSRELSAQSKPELPIENDTKKNPKDSVLAKQEKFILNFSKNNNNLDVAINKFLTVTTPKYNKQKGKKGGEEAFNKYALELTNIILGLEIESHYALTESFTEHYQIMVKELSGQLIKEGNHSTYVEKMLVEVVVNAFVRVLDNSRRLNNELECINITPNRNVFISILSKQLDRANRQFLNALMTLKQLKYPAIEMNIRANTAFVAQNQQINVDKKPNEAK